MKPCIYCGNEYEGKAGKKYCSQKCQLLNNITEENGCWIWQGALTNCGYGKSSIKAKFIGAHRQSYKIFKGNIPKNKIVCHTCDTKKCINPDHLWLGTHKDNWQDAYEKGLIKKTTGLKWSLETREKMKSRPAPNKKGEQHHLRKLSNQDVFDIREMLEKCIKQVEIAKIYNVDPSCISNIKRKRNWSHM